MYVLDRLFLSETFKTTFDRNRARFVYITVLLIAILFLGFLVFVEPSLTEPFKIISIASIIVGGSTTLILLRMGNMRAASMVFIATWMGSNVILAVRDGFQQSSSTLSLLVLVLLSVSLFTKNGTLIGLLLALPMLLWGYSRRVEGTIIVQPVSDAIVVIFYLVGGAFTFYLFVRNLSLRQEETLLKAGEDRLRLATITTDIARNIANQKELTELLSNTVDEIRERYVEIYHAQIFLIDPSINSARLVASTGEVGALLIGRGHNLAVGSVSVIGQVTSNATSIIARAGSSDTIHRRNELLPETMVEAAFPLIIGTQVIGALDLQSRDITAFTTEDLPIFQSLADNIAVAISNARLFEQTESRLRENQRLIDQMRGAMREIERLNRQMTEQSWTQFLNKQNDTSSVDINFKTNVIERNQNWTPTLRDAVQKNATIQKRELDNNTIAIPIRVRGQVIGAMEFELEQNASIIEAADIAQTVSERFGLALENTRLYQETQRGAQREQQVNNIATQFQSVTTIDELLRITLSELGDLLGAERASIRLSNPDAIAPAGNGAGNQNGKGKP